jgi:hypothetical protein
MCAKIAGCCSSNNVVSKKVAILKNSSLVETVVESPVQKTELGQFSHNARSSGC